MFRALLWGEGADGHRSGLSPTGEGTMALTYGRGPADPRVEMVATDADEGAVVFDRFEVRGLGRIFDERNLKLTCQIQDIDRLEDLGISLAGVSSGEVFKAQVALEIIGVCRRQVLMCEKIV